MHSHYLNRRNIVVTLFLTLLFVGGFWYIALERVSPVYAAGITFRSMQSASVNTGTSVTVTKPAGVVGNDVLIASAVTNTSGGDVVTPPSGWTQVRKTVQGTLVMYTWYKVAGASEPASYVFTMSVAKQVAVIMLAYSGVDTTSPVMVQGGVGSSVTSSTITAPSIITTGPNTMLVGTFSVISSPLSTYSTYSNAMTERQDLKTSGGGASLSFAMADAVQASAGATGVRTAVASKNGAPQIGHLLALRSPNQVPTVTPTASAVSSPLTLSSNSVTLTGNATDPDGTIASRLWSKVSGPAGESIVSPSADITSVTGLSINSTYTFRLTATDNGGASNSGTVNVVVPANQIPIVYAGADQTLPYANSSSAALSGSSSDNDGSIASRSWSKFSGPSGAVTFTSGSADNTTVNGLLPNNAADNVYVFRLTATDNLGGVNSDDVQITVPKNLPPTVSAGPDVNVTTASPSGVTVTLNGSASDVPGGPPSPTVLWTKVSGPLGGTIVNPTNAVTDVTGIDTSTGGTNIYRLTATDNLGTTANDTMQVIVPANYPPVIDNCTAPQSITLPSQNTATIQCRVTDADSLVYSVQWTKGRLATGNPPNPPGDTIVYDIGPKTDVTYNIAQGAGGTYNYLLTATDDYGATGTGTAQVLVSVAGNAAPVVNAGADQSIALPNTTSVTVTGSYADSIPTSPSPTVVWSKVSGPAGGTIQSPNSLTTGITGLSNSGTYVFRLTVTDAWGAVGTDDVAITAGVPAFSTTVPVTGVTWASSIGWVSFGPPNGGNVIVHTDTGNLSGYAWAANAGYISFDPAPDGVHCTASPCAVMDMSASTKEKKVTGWARACSVLVAADCSGTAMKPNAQRGGWDGWIKLYASQVGGVWEWTNPATWSSLMTSNTSLWGTPYDPFGFHGVFYDDLSGFAWGGIVVGWVDFFGASVLLPVPVLQVDPIQLDFGDVWVGSSKDLDFTVSNVGDLGSFLRGLASIADTTYFRCVTNCDYTASGIPVGTTSLVTIRFTPGMTAATGLTTQVNFTGTNTSPPSSVNKTVLGNAIIPVFGNGLNFGNVVVGKYKELTLTFSNAGAVDLGADIVVMPFPEYTCIPSCVANLAPGVPNNITIRFTPTAVQTYNGDAYLQNNPSVTFPFTGAGVLGAFKFKDQ